MPKNKKEGNQPEPKKEEKFVLTAAQKKAALLALKKEIEEHKNSCIEQTAKHHFFAWYKQAKRKNEDFTIEKFCEQYKDSPNLLKPFSPNCIWEDEKDLYDYLLKELANLS